MPTRLGVAQPELLSVANEIVIVCDLSLASLRDVNRVRRFAGAAGSEARQTVVANLVGTRKGDRKSTRLTPVTNAHLVCRLLLEKKNTKTQQQPNKQTTIT